MTELSTETAAWKTEVARVRGLDPAVADYMERTGLDAAMASLEMHGAAAMADDSPWNPSDQVRTY
jgi:hypothetical protein